MLAATVSSIGSGRIEGLLVARGPLIVTEEVTTGELFTKSVLLPIAYRKREGWKLQYVSGDPVRLNQRGGAQLRIVLQNGRATLNFLAMGPENSSLAELQTIELREQYVEPKLIQKKSEQQKPRKEDEENLLLLYPQVGLTWIGYQEDGIQPFTQTALTARFAALYLLAPRWIVNTYAYFTSASVGSSLPGVTARFFGVGATTGLHLPRPSDPWRLMLTAGMSYTTTFVTADRFGFKHLFGPQLYPMLSRSLSKRDLLRAYFKYTPLLGEAIVNQEVGAGLAYHRLLSNSHPFSLSLDWTKLDFEAETSKIETSAFGLSAGYGL